MARLLAPFALVGAIGSLFLPNEVSCTPVLCLTVSLPLSLTNSR